METINQRIQLIVDKYHNGNVSAFCRDLGIRQSTMKDILGSRKSKPSNETFAKMISATSINIDPTWLLTGDGEMLNSVTKEMTNEDTFIEKQLFESQMRIKIMREQIEELKRENRELIALDAVIKAEYNIKDDKDDEGEDLTKGGRA